MPNWCNNVLTLTHEDPKLIERARVAAKSNTLFNEFLPMPTEFQESIGGYDWALSNWGTKWDADVTYVSDADLTGVEIHFDTAWSPPIEFYQHLESIGFEVTGRYFEPGCAFIGEYSGGADSCYKLDTTNKNVCEGIPDDLVAIFDPEDWFEPISDDSEDAEA